MSDNPPPDAPHPASSDPGAGQGPQPPAYDAPPPAPYAAPAPASDAPAPSSSAPQVPPYAPQAPQYAPQAPQYAPQAPQYSPPGPQVPPYAAATAPSGPTAPSYVQRYPGAPPQMSGPGGTTPPSYPPGTPGLEGYPGQPQRDGRSKVLAIVALCLAIGGLLLIWIPFVSIISIPLLLGAIVLAIIALVMKSQGGTGFSIAALIVAGGGGLIALIVTAIIALLFGVTAATVSGIANDPDSGFSDGQTYGADQELEIVETATGAGDEDTGLYWYAVVIDNPNDVAFDSALITIEGLDADGNSVGEGTDYRMIPPGKTAITGYFTGIGDDVPVTVEVDLPDAADAAVVDAPDGEMTVSNIATTTDGSLTDVTGTITSSLSEDVDLPVVALIVRDSSGKIINADVDYPDELPAGGTVDFDALFYPALPEGATVEGYAYQ